MQHPVLRDHTVGTQKILRQIVKDLFDSRLYVIKPTMCAAEEEKYKDRMWRKRKRLPVMSTFACLFFLTLPLNSSWLVSGSQVYSSRTLLGSDAALCICSGEDRTTAAINYSAGTPMPQSLLGILPVCYQHFLPSCFSHIHSCANSRHKWARIV